MNDGNYTRNKILVTIEQYTYIIYKLHTHSIHTIYKHTHTNTIKFT